MSEKTVGFILILSSAAMGACIVPLAKIASSVVPPLSIVFWRVFLASIIFIPIAYKNKEKISIHKIKKLMPLSVILSVNFTAAVVSVKFIPTSLTPIIYATTPLVTYAITQIRSKKPEFRKKYLFGMSIGFVGLLIATVQNLNAQTDILRTFFGVAMVFVGVICFSVYGIKSKDYQKEMGPIQISWINVIVASFVLSPFALFDTVTTAYVAKIGIVHLSALIGIAFFGSVMAYLTYQYAIKHTSASIASLMTYIQPIFGVILSIVLVGEKVSPTFVMGASMALIGAFIASRQTA